MNFGQNLLTWLQGQLVPIFIIVVLIGCITLAMKRSITGLIGFVIFMAAVGAIVVKPTVIPELGKKLWDIVFA